MGQDIQTEIDAEMARAVAKFPMWPTDMYHAFAIVGEEIGEVFKDIVQYHYEPHKNKSPETIRAECLQSMCMLMRFVAALDSGHYQMPACTQAPQSMPPAQGGKTRVQRIKELEFEIAQLKHEQQRAPY